MAVAAALGAEKRERFFREKVLLRKQLFREKKAASDAMSEATTCRRGSDARGNSIETDLLMSLSLDHCCAPVGSWHRQLFESHYEYGASLGLLGGKFGKVAQL